MTEQERIKKTIKNRKKYLRRKERCKNDLEYKKKLYERKRRKLKNKLSENEEYRKNYNRKNYLRRKKRMQSNDDFRIKMNQKKYKRWKTRWENDELFAIKVRMRNLIRNRLTRMGYTKSKMNKTETILGCSYVELKEYFESKFVNGMNWENRGEWHIDHIIPLSSANSKEELLALCHYTNLQPLWAKDNLEKGDKIL